APNARVLGTDAIASGGDLALVSGALEDLKGVPDVSEDRAVPQIVLIGVVGGPVEGSGDPVRTPWHVLAGEELLLVVTSPEDPGEGQLLGVAHALDAIRLGLRLGKGREEHAGKDRDDGDDHQQLNEGKTLISGS